MKKRASTSHLSRDNEKGRKGEGETRKGPDTVPGSTLFLVPELRFGNVFRETPFRLPPHAGGTRNSVSPSSVPEREFGNEGET
jgi:hypothetical protein